jgi:hypothetical protein
MTYSLAHHHKYECEIIDDLLKSGIKHIVLRLFFTGLSNFKNIDEMEKFLNEKKSVKMTAFEYYAKFKSMTGDNACGKHLFLATLSLATNDCDQKHSLADYEIIFNKSSTLKLLWQQNKIFISSILQKLIIIGHRDIHGIGAWSLKLNQSNDEPKNPSNYQQLIGNACYLFSSLLNHSCAPNVKRFNLNTNNVIIVSRPIKAGGQLFDSYRQNFNLQPKIQRQQSLFKDYGFECDCEACIKDWPLNKDLKVISDDLLETAWEAHDELPFLNRNLAVERFKKYCHMISKYHKHYPSAELVIFHECLDNCLFSITKPSHQFS